VPIKVLKLRSDQKCNPRGEFPLGKLNKSPDNIKYEYQHSLLRVKKLETVSAKQP